MEKYSQKMSMTLYDCTMFLVFISIFCVVHFIFKNIKQICLWVAKFAVTCMLWSFVWVATNLQGLPQWKSAFKDSIWKLVNLTQGNTEL